MDPETGRFIEEDPIQDELIKYFSHLNKNTTGNEEISFGADYFDPALGKLDADEVIRQFNNPYAYCLNNPLIYVDPDGRVVETVWDAANIAMDVASIADDVANKDYVGLAIDAGSLIYDAIATGVPVLPGGTGALRVAAKAATWIDRAKDAIKLGNKLSDPMKNALRSKAVQIMKKNSEAFAKAVASGVKAQVHHVIPLEWAHKMGKNFDPNTLKNLKGYASDVHSQITREWAAFKKQFKDPTAEQIENFSKHISKKYEKYEIK